MNERTHEILQDEFAIEFARYLIEEEISDSLLKEMLVIFKKKKENE